MYPRLAWSFTVCPRMTLNPPTHTPLYFLITDMGHYIRLIGAGYQSQAVLIKCSN